MKGKTLLRSTFMCGVTLLAAIDISCAGDPKAAATKSEITFDADSYTVEHPDLFNVAKVETMQLPTTLKVNGSIAPDINRAVHVTSQASGRVVELKIRLGDSVNKGQVLLAIHSADLASAFSDYQKAAADARLANKALGRAQLLYSHGALAEKDLQQAADTEEKAQADVQNTEQRVRLLGGDPVRPGALIELHAPISGTIVEQNIAGFEGIKSLDNSPSLFTIADLSQVWVLCDVYENDLGAVHLGDIAEVQLTAYPDHRYHGKISDISRVLDPATRSAKVRIVLPNRDGSLRPGMFAVATFRSRALQPEIVVPCTALIRLQDKDWVFRKEGAQRFHRIEVHTLSGVARGMQPIRDGLRAGDEIVANALEFASAIAEQGK
jgi:cobalt-zinc-cadmium efflux system membrane fusion protein